MQKWEYEVVDLEALDSEEDSEEDGRDSATALEDGRDSATAFKEFLNEKGQHGWELVGVKEMEPFLVFKKLKPRPGHAP